jgi:hypothetical protein
VLECAGWPTFTLIAFTVDVTDRLIPTVSLFWSERIKKALPLRLGVFQRIGKAQSGEPREVTVSCM